MIRNEILKALRAATGSEDIKLDIPSVKDHGDYATSIALGKGECYTKELVSKLRANSELNNIISKIEIAGPGFINFFISDEALLQTVANPVSPFSLEEDGRRRTVIVEYSSPNIAKPFGVGHFRSTIIGNALANLLEADGWEVHRDNHLGDWGTQFGKLIYKIKAQSSKLKTTTEDLNLTIKELVDLYVEFHTEAEKDPTLEGKAREEFRLLEAGDPENRKIWQYCVDVSLKEFNKVYEILGIKFTENDGLGYGESYFETMMPEVIKELSEKGLLKEGKEGAKLVFFENDKYPPLMIVKKDGTTLYATRDLAADKFRLEKYGKDTIIINEVGAEQSLYFQQLFEVERMLGWVKEGQRVHVKHGLFRFADRKMSTRRGDIIWFDDVLKEAISKARKFGSNQKLAQEVAVGALKWNELKRDPVKDIIFDWDEILNMDGNSGPYLQYTYARTASILSKADSEVLKRTTASKPFDDSERKVARVLLHFPEIVKDAANFYSPHILANYLFNLAQEFNSFYNSERVIDHEREGTRLLLVKAVGAAIKKGLNLLGIEAPSKM